MNGHLDHARLQSTRRFKAFVFWFVIVLSGVLLWVVVRNSQPSAPEIAYSDLLREIAEDNLSEVKINGQILNGTRRDGSSFRVVIPEYQVYTLDLLRERDIRVVLEKTTTPHWFVNLLPLFALLALWFLMIRTLRKGQQVKAGSGPSGQ